MSNETDLSKPADAVEIQAGADKPGLAADLEMAFDIQSEVARGGMGIIYKGFHKNLQRICAIKVLQPLDDETGVAQKRFLKEAQLVSSFDHPNIVKIFNIGFDKSNHPFFAMEWLEGCTLDSVLKREKRLSISEFKNIFSQVLSALSYSHSRSIVHRDIKPSNIFLTKDDQGTTVVKLLDFGIARNLEQSASASMKLTSTGTLLGTPRYMSPEQCNSQPADQRSDIYSVAVVMYESLAGGHLFEAENPLEIMYKQLKEEPDSSRLPSDPKFRKLNECIMLALKKDPQARYQSVDEFIAVLDAALSELRDSDLIKSGNTLDLKSKKQLRNILAVTCSALLFLGIVAFLFLNRAKQSDAALTEMRPVESSSLTSCKVLISKAKEAYSQLILAKKRQDWIAVSAFEKQTEDNYKACIKVGSSRVDELVKLPRLSEVQRKQLIDDGNEVHNAGLQLGDFLFEQGRIDEALKAMNIASSYASQNFYLSTLSINRKATTLQYQQKFDEALAVLREQLKSADKILAEQKKTGDDEGIKPNREYWMRLGEIWAIVGDQYVCLEQKNKAVEAYKKALSASSVNHEIEGDTASMILRQKLASVTNEKWLEVYLEALDKREVKAYRTAEVMRCYAAHVYATDQVKAREAFREAFNTLKSGAFRNALLDADAFGRIVQTYADLEIDTKLNSKNTVKRFGRAKVIADEGEQFVKDHSYSPRLRASVSYIRGVIAFLSADYERAIAEFEFAERDCGNDPFSLSHMAKLMHGQALLEMKRDIEGCKKFLEVDPTMLQFAETIKTGPRYLSKALWSCAGVFERSGKSLIAKRIRDQLRDAKRPSDD